MTDTASRTVGRTRGRDAPPPRPAARGSRKSKRRIRRFLNDQGDWILVGLSLIFLVAYAWPILDPHLNHTTRQIFEIGQWSAWAGFALDYFARLWAARDRRRYFTKHLLDLVIVVLPVLGPLRLVRLVVIFRVVNRKAGASMRGHVPLYVTVSAAALIFCASLAVLSAERGAPPSMHANILTIGTALWWACVTVTTVGYGDHYPVTAAGRAIGIVLMIVGVGIFGVVAASAATWFITASQEEDSRHQADKIAALTGEITALRQAIAELSAHSGDGRRNSERQLHRQPAPVTGRRSRASPRPGQRNLSAT